MTLEPGGKWYERKMEEEMSVHTSLGLAGSQAARAHFLGSTRHWFCKGLYHLIVYPPALAKVVKCLARYVARYFGPAVHSNGILAFADDVFY